MDIDNDKQYLPLFVVKSRRNHLVKYSHRRVRDLKVSSDWKKRSMRRVGVKEEGFQTKNSLH